ADVGRVDERAPVLLVLGHLAKARRRVGDRDERPARLRDVTAAGVQRLFPEVTLERLDLDRAARLRRHDEEHLLARDLLVDAGDGSQPRRLLTDFSCSGFVEKSVASLFHRRSSALAPARRATSASLASRSASGRNACCRFAAISAIAARRASMASTSAIIEPENDFTPS